MNFQPRQWQLDAAKAFFEYRGPKGRLVSAATGTGKTAFGHMLAERYLAAGERVLWIAHRRELITQPLATLRRWWPQYQGGIVSVEGIIISVRGTTYVLTVMGSAWLEDDTTVATTLHTLLISQEQAERIMALEPNKCEQEEHVGALLKAAPQALLLRKQPLSMFICEGSRMDLLDVEARLPELQADPIWSILLASIRQMAVSVWGPPRTWSEDKAPSTPRTTPPETVH